MLLASSSKNFAKEIKKHGLEIENVFLYSFFDEAGELPRDVSNQKRLECIFLLKSGLPFIARRVDNKVEKKEIESAMVYASAIADSVNSGQSICIVDEFGDQWAPFLKRLSVLLMTIRDPECRLSGKERPTKAVTTDGLSLFLNHLTSSSSMASESTVRFLAEAWCEKINAICA